jgi:general secretion pathway protein M
MKQWWMSRTSQEQRALMIGGAVVCLLMIYLLIWEPFAERVDIAAMRVKSQQSTLIWMQESAARIKQLKSSGSAGKPAASNQALLTLVDRTAKQNRLRDYIQRLKPQGSNSVQIWMEQAPFDNLIKWLGRLESENGVNVESLSISREEGAGMVKARINLQRGES